MENSIDCKIGNFQTEGALLYSKTSRQIGAVEALLPSVNKHKNH